MGTGYEPRPGVIVHLPSFSELPYRFRLADPGWGDLVRWLAVRCIGNGVGYFCASLCRVARDMDGEFGDSHVGLPELRTTGWLLCLAMAKGGTTTITLILGWQITVIAGGNLT